MLRRRDATPRVERDPDVLYRQLAPSVLGYLRAQGVRDPDDVLMDVFVAVVRDVHRVRGDDDAVRRWVFTIAHHRIVDQRRRETRRSRFGSVAVDELAEDPRLAEPATDVPVTDPALTEALAALSPDQRAVVGLRLVADLPVRDVARILRKRPDAVKALQHRALTRLAELLGS